MSVIAPLRSNPRRRRLPCALAGGSLVAALLVAAGPSYAAPGRGVATDHPNPAPGRTVIAYTVRPGDTATGLAVRFHAWTRELRALNHLDSRGTIYVGQQLRIPIVTDRAGTGSAPPAPPKPAAQPTAAPAQPCTTCRSSQASRQQVRAAIVAAASRHGVDPELALAISWQEAGWQMPVTSGAGAIGAMQVMPATGTWMAQYAGRALDLRRMSDNVEAGVLFLKVLRRMFDDERDVIAAYYQGPGAVRRHGHYPETIRYVENVLAIKRRIEAGHAPG